MSIVLVLMMLLGDMMRNNSALIHDEALHDAWRLLPDKEVTIMTFEPFLGRHKPVYVSVYECM